jgi:hypothetical protein
MSKYRPGDVIAWADGYCSDVVEVGMFDGEECVVLRNWRWWRYWTDPVRQMLVRVHCRVIGKDRLVWWGKP